MNRINRIGIFAFLNCCVVAVTAVIALAQPGPTTAPTLTFKVIAPTDTLDVEPKDINFSWHGVATATQYEVQVGSETGFGNPIIQRTLGNETALTFRYPLLRGRTYKWRVIALAGNQEIGRSEEGSLKTRTIFEYLREDVHLTLRRSYSKKDSPDFADPASFGFVRAAGDAEDTFAIDGTLEWLSGYTIPIVKKDGWTAFSVEPAFSVEAHVGTNPDAKADQIRFRGGFEGDFNFIDPRRLKPAIGDITDPIGPNEPRPVPGAVPFITGVWVTFPFVYETNRGYDTQKFTFEPELSPNIPSVGIGEAIPLFRNRAQGEVVPKWSDRPETRTGVWLYWRPRIGLNVGKTLDDPFIKATKKVPHPDQTNPEVFRIVGTVNGRLMFPDVARNLSVNNFALFAEDKMYYMPGDFDDEGGEDFHNHLSTGLEIGFTDNLSVTITYDVGETTPSFAKKETVSIQLGLKF